MIATPLARRGDDARRAWSSVVVAGLAATTTLNVGRRWGGRRARLAAAVVVTGTAVLERVGTATGVPVRPVPVHRSAATDRRRRARRRAAGVVGDGACRHARRPTPRSAGGRRRRGGWPLGAAALTAWDLFLDPQMTAEGYWRWARPGAYRGIPVSNFAGWLLAGAVVMAALEALLPPGRHDRGLVAEYAGMGVMETVGFAAFFRDPLVAAAGAVGMLPICRPGPGAVAERVDVVVVGAGVGGLAVAARLAAAGRPGRRVRAATRHRRQVGHPGPRRVPLRPRPVAADAAGPVRRAVPGGRYGADRSRRPGAPRPAVPLPLGRRVVAGRAGRRRRHRRRRSRRLAPGAGAEWRRFDARGRRIWDVAARTFLAGPMEAWRAASAACGRRPTSSPSSRCAPCTAWPPAASRDPRLVQWAGRYATYSGSSPFRAPATLACIAHVESAGGCWYPMGGLEALRARARGRRRRRRVRTSEPASRWPASAPGTGPSPASSWPTARSSRHRWSSPTPTPRRSTLGCCPTPPGVRRVRRAGRSTSGFVVTAAVRGRTPGIGHHNVWFAPDDRAEFGPSRPGGWPTRRRSTPACPRPPTRARHRPATRTGSCSSTPRPGIELDAGVERRARARPPGRARRRPAPAPDRGRRR